MPMSWLVTMQMSWLHIADVLAADTTDVLAADKYVASEEVGLRRLFPGKNGNPSKTVWIFMISDTFRLYFDSFWYI